MKKIIIPLFFVTLVAFTYIICVVTINNRSDGSFIYDVGYKQLSDYEIYKTDKIKPKLIGNNNIRRKYSYTQTFKKGLFFPKVKSDTIWTSSIYYDNN